MTPALPSLLVVDDEKNMRLSLQNILRTDGYRMRGAESAEEALQALEEEIFFMVITDARLGGMSGYDFLSQVKKRRPDLPVLMITAYATPKLAVDAIQAGALDYLSKPFAPEELLHAVARCAERFRLLRDNASLRARDFDAYRLDRIIGNSPRMVELRQLVGTVAPTQATVLILGESGTGKELIAGALHTLSARAEKNYVRINCAAIPEALLESELFGHEKGSFTGAVRQKQGRVEEADGGTIFLDEIGDMSRPLQAKLLRFLEDGSFTRVGDNEELRVNVRMLAATNRDIIASIQKNEFREDLFHRLNVVQFRPPPLRERGTDVLLLADHFLQHFNAVMKKRIQGFTPAARKKLLNHHWPGNVRELRNVVERAVILESSPEIEAGNVPDFHLEGQLRKEENPGVNPGDSLDEIMSRFEARLITSTLEQNHFSLTRTAEQLKISRHALRYRMQRLNINPGSEGEEESQNNP